MAQANRNGAGVGRRGKRGVRRKRVGRGTGMMVGRGVGKGRGRGRKRGAKGGLGVGRDVYQCLRELLLLHAGAC